MLMYQTVARHIAQLLENHWTGNNSPTLVSGTTFSHKHKAALFYHFFPFFDNTMGVNVQLTKIAVCL